MALAALLPILILGFLLLVGFFTAWRAVALAGQWSRFTARLTLLAALPLCLATIGVGGTLIWYHQRPQPRALERELFQGVHYQRRVLIEPRPLVMHIVTVALRAPGIELLVTPGTGEEGLEYRACSTSEFLAEHGLQVAINGGFFAFVGERPRDNAPDPGQALNIYGLSVSDGQVVSPQIAGTPTLYFFEGNQADFHPPGNPGAIRQAISGSRMLLVDGELRTRPGEPWHSEHLAPRSMIGLDSGRERLFLIVLDGRQPNYSEGATLEEAALLARGMGVSDLLNLDGGGSSVLVAADRRGRPRLLNSPIQARIPGRERPVANHLGIRAKPLER